MRLPAAVRARVQDLHSNRGLRSASVLVGGTAAGQAVTVLALPLLTRFYSPVDFSILAIFSGILTILTYASTGRFDVAIPLPDDDREAVSLFVLALLCAVVTAALAAIVLALFGDALAELASIEEARPYFWLLPFSILLSGTFLAVQGWSIRRKQFKSIATTRVHQTVAGVGVQATMGALGYRPLGLLLGQLLISGAGSFRLMREFWRHDRRLLASVDIRRLRRTAHKNRQFPQYSVIDAIAANAGDQLPVIIIAALHGTAAGLLYLTMRVLGAPVRLIANAVSQVYLSNAGKAHKEGYLRESTEKLARALMIYGAAPLLFVSLAATPLFGIVFGGAWTDAGRIMMWVAPWYALRLAVFPLVSIPAVLGEQRLIMVVRLSTLLLRLVAVYIGFYFWGGRAIEALALASIIHWLILMCLFFRLAGVRIRDLGLQFFALPIAAGVCGLLVAQLVLSLVQ